MSQVILVGKDWTFRALIRAQLLEEGLDVEAYETAGDAAKAIVGRYRLPKLMVADLTSSDDPGTELSQLARWAERFPVWIIAGREIASDAEAHDPRFQRILFRPVDVGQLVKEIKSAVHGR
jgi:DNA-binding NtrC family response regulator